MRARNAAGTQEGRSKQFSIICAGVFIALTDFLNIFYSLSNIELRTSGIKHRELFSPQPREPLQ
jgi:hypothetical protein